MARETAIQAAEIAAMAARAAACQEKIARLFSDHLGLDYKDLLAACGQIVFEYRVTPLHVVGAKPVSSIPLRPLKIIPADSPLRRAAPNSQL